MSLNINKDLVLHISKLARIKITDDEVSEYEKNFKSIVEYIEKLKEVDTSNVEMLSNPMTLNLSYYEKELGVSRKQRQDEIRPSLNVKEVVKNAPDSKNNEFRIQSVIENS